MSSLFTLCTIFKPEQIFQKSITLKKLLAERRQVIFHPYGETFPLPSNPIVTKCGLCVPLHDLINCAKLQLYRANSFSIVGPRGVPIDLRGDIYNIYRALSNSAVL